MCKNRLAVVPVLLLLHIHVIWAGSGHLKEEDAWKREIRALRRKSHDFSRQGIHPNIRTPPIDASNIDTVAILTPSLFEKYDRERVPVKMTSTFDLSSARSRLALGNILDSFPPNSEFETNTFETTKEGGRKRQRVKLSSFVPYLHEQKDAQPLEIFHDFSHQTRPHQKEIRSMYSVPSIFSTDIFDTLPEILQMVL